MLVYRYCWPLWGCLLIHWKLCPLPAQRQSQGSSTLSCAFLVMCRLHVRVSYPSVTGPGVWKWGYTKNRTYRRPFMNTVHASLAGNPGALPSPSKKNEFVIGEDVISSCLVGLTLTLLFSLFLVDILSRSQFLSHPPPYPHYFYANLDKLRDLYFQKVGYVPPGSHGFDSDICRIVIGLLHRHYHVSFILSAARCVAICVVTLSSRTQRLRPVAARRCRLLEQSTRAERSILLRSVVCHILISLLYTVAWFDVQMCRKWCDDTSALLLIADRPTAQLNSVAVLRDGARPGAPHCLSIQKWSLTSSSCRPRYCLRSFPCGLWLAVGYSILLQVASCLLFSIHLLLLLLIRSRR